MTKNKKRHCDYCGSKQRTYIRFLPVGIQFKEKRVKFKARRRICKVCHNEVYDSKLDNILTKKALRLRKNK